MNYRKLFFTSVALLIPSVTFAAETVTLNTELVPVQKNVDSSQVIYIFNDRLTLTKQGASGEMYSIEYITEKGTTLNGWIDRKYTVEGVEEIVQEDNAKKSSVKEDTAKEDSGTKAQTIVNYTTNLSANSTFAQVAAERKKYVYMNRYTYAQTSSMIPLNASKSRVVDCSQFVSDVIYNYGKLKGNSGLMSIKRKNSVYYNGIGESLQNGGSSKYFALINPSNMKAGDILCYTGHVEIYAGSMDGNHYRVYNCGGNEAIQCKTIVSRSAYSTSSSGKYKLNYVLRVKV